jgi:hypothetical protein
MGRKPLPVLIAPNDVAVLRLIAGDRSLPVYQVHRAQIVLAIAAGERTRQMQVFGQAARSSAKFALCITTTPGFMLLWMFARLSSVMQKCPVVS